MSRQLDAQAGRKTYSELIDWDVAGAEHTADLYCQWASQELLASVTPSWDYKGYIE